MTKGNNKNLEELKKEIVLERLRQAPLNIKVSFGNLDGNFLNRDELIGEVKKDTEIGKKIVEIQIEYLRSFKKGLLMGE